MKSDLAQRQRLLEKNVSGDWKEVLLQLCFCQATIITFGEL